MIFPDWGQSPNTQETRPLPLLTEWAVDWEQSAFALRNGQPYTVTGLEALKIWVRLALHPGNERFAYSAHSHDYGNEIAALLGVVTDPGIRESRLRQYLREALLVSPYITAVEEMAFAGKGSVVTVSFTVRSVYGEFTQNLEVPNG